MSAPVSIKWTLGETYRARLSIDDLFDPTTAFTPVHGEILAKLKAATALTKEQATWEPSSAKTLIEIRLPGCKTYETLCSAHRTPTLVARRARLRVVNVKEDVSLPSHESAEQSKPLEHEAFMTSEVHDKSECPDLLKAFLEAGSSPAGAVLGGGSSAAGAANTSEVNASTTDVTDSGRPHPVLPTYTPSTDLPSRSTFTFGSGRPWGNAHARPVAPRFVTQNEVSAMIDAKISELSTRLTAHCQTRDQGSQAFDYAKHKCHPHRHHSRGERAHDFVHNAICDACDKHIRGERFKCLECPDFDSCSQCWDKVRHEHGLHRFVKVLDDSLVPARSPKVLAVHHGILCDGPLCQRKKTPITGDRYRCLVCADYDHCASCEAYPRTSHNINHPMMKMRMPNAESYVKQHSGQSVKAATGTRTACVFKQDSAKEPFTSTPESPYSRWPDAPLVDVQKGQAIKDELKQAFVDLGSKMRTAMNTCEAVRKVKHLTVVCDGCDKTVYGHRYMCASCEDYDLCQACYNENDHAKNHVFVLYKHFVNNVIVPRTSIAAVSPVPRAGEHKGYFCNECSQSPMLGKRYNCLICKDYDACENCKDMHQFVDHPLQIVPAIGAAPVTEKNEASLTVEDESVELLEHESAVVHSEKSKVSMPVTDDGRSKSPSLLITNMSGDAEQALEHGSGVDRALSSEFVEDISIPDGTVVTAGVSFVKQWLVKNDGCVAWPAGIRAVVTGGTFSKCIIPETFSADSGEGGLALDQPVQPGESVVMSVQLRAPVEQQFNATTYFKLATKEGFRFGCKLWIDVDVSREVVEQVNRPNTAQTTATTSTEASTHSDMIFPSASMELRKNSIVSEESTSCAGTQQADDWHSEDEISLSDDEDYDVLDNESFSDEA